MSVPVNLDGRNVAQIFTTSKAYAALMTDGTVVAFGPSDFGGDNSAVKSSLISIKNIASTKGKLGGAFAAVTNQGTVVSYLLNEL